MLKMQLLAGQILYTGLRVLKQEQSHYFSIVCFNEHFTFHAQLN